MYFTPIYRCDGKEFGTIGEVEAHLNYMFENVEEIGVNLYRCYNEDDSYTDIEVEEIIENW